MYRLLLRRNFQRSRVSLWSLNRIRPTLRSKSRAMKWLSRHRNYVPLCPRQRVRYASRMPTASRFWLKTLTGGPLLRWKWKVRKDIQYVRYSSRQAMMRLSMAWASTRRMSSTIKVRMRNCSSTIQRCLYPSSCLIKTTVCFGTAIRSAVSVTRVTTHNWVMSSNFMIKRARKVLWPVHIFRARKTWKPLYVVRILFILNIWTVPHIWVRWLICLRSSRSEGPT